MVDDNTMSCYNLKLLMTLGCVLECIYAYGMVCMHIGVVCLWSGVCMHIYGIDGVVYGRIHME